MEYEIIERVKCDTWINRILIAPTEATTLVRKPPEIDARSFAINWIWLLLMIYVVRNRICVVQKTLLKSRRESIVLGLNAQKKRLRRDVDRTVRDKASKLISNFW